MGEFADYLAKIADSRNRTRVQDVLHWVTREFPSLLPKLAWNQPMFTDHGTFIIGLSVSKQHLAIAPERACLVRFLDEIAQAGYDSSKELFRIPWSDSVNYALLEQMILFNMSDKKDCTTFWRK